MKQLKQEGARIIAHSGVSHRDVKAYAVFATGCFLINGCPFQALVNISNGIVQDSRVFHLEDQNFLDLYNKQSMFSYKRA